MLNGDLTGVIESEMWKGNGRFVPVAVHAESATCVLAQYVCNEEIYTFLI